MFGIAFLVLVPAAVIATIAKRQQFVKPGATGETGRGCCE